MLNHRLTPWIIALCLLALSLAVRLPNLGQFLTTDETKWMTRSRWFSVGLFLPEQECPAVDWGRTFATHGWGCTLQIGYPGVTPMALGSLGLMTHYWWSVAPTGTSLQEFLTSLRVNVAAPELIAPMRWPLAVVGALFVPVFFLLLRRLVDQRVALLAALLVALSPFQIALSRVLHHDSLNTTFMVLSLLALLGYWLRGWRWTWLLLSAGLGGLALLSKQVSWFLPPFVAVLAVLVWLYRAQSWRDWRLAGRLIIEGLLWGLWAVGAFIALFPAMWVIPGEVLTVIFNVSTELADAGHRHLFFGEIVYDPGWWFYPVGWLFRATPLELIGLALALLAAGWLLASGRLWGWIKQHPIELALLLFVGLLYVFVNQSDKKLVRYALPAFPIIGLFAALGLVALVDWLTPRIPRLLGDQIATAAIAGLIVLLHGGLSLQNYPYYFTYHNPLLGGTRQAAKVMTIIGWGEGLDQAAAFLNRQPNAEQLQVVSEIGCLNLRPFFVGKTACLNSTVGGILKADYLVYYYNVVQRGMGQQDQWLYFDRHQTPVERATFDGLDYVRTYHNPIEQQINRQINRQPNALAALGYNLSDEGQLTLFWQNLGLNSGGLLLGLAPSDGVYRIGGPGVDAKRVWLRCQPKPAFTAELNSPNRIIESDCDLSAVQLPPGLYDIKLATGSQTEPQPIESSRLAVIQLTLDGAFQPVALEAFPAEGS